MPDTGIRYGDLYESLHCLTSNVHWETISTEKLFIQGLIRRRKYIG